MSYLSDFRTNIEAWLRKWHDFAEQDIELSKQEYLSLAKWCFWIGVPAHIAFALHFSFNMNLQEDWYWRIGIVLAYVGFYIGVHNEYYVKNLKHLHRYLWLTFSIVQLIYLPMHLYYINHYDIMWLTSFPFFALMLLATIKSFDLFWAGITGLFSTLIVMHFDDSARMDIVMALYMAPLCVGGYAMIYVRNLQRQALNKATLIEESYNKLKEYEMRKDDFIASVAHEIRTPLSIAVSGVEDITEVLHARIGCDSCNVSVLKSCGMITSALQSIQSQIHDLIEAEKLSRANIILAKQSVALDDWVPAISEKLNAMCRTKSIKYQCVLSQSGITSVFDPVRMETVLTNLVSNAVKFTPAHGSVLVVIESTQDNELTFVVKDTGCGIAQQDLPFIFDKYYQANENNCLGIGLGLSLVRIIVQAHEGRIAVMSSRNKGTKMTVVLGRTNTPIFNTGPVLVGDDSSCLDSAVYDSSKDLLFVVEDNHVMLDVLNTRLSKTYSVLSFGDAEHALDALVLYKPVLFICDINLPGISGVALMIKVREQYPDMPFLFVTAHAGVHGMLTGHQNTFVIEKPFVYGDLDRTVRAILNANRKLPT